MIAVALLYVALGLFGLELAVPPGYATLVWPASGLAVTTVLLFGPQLWPGILIGAFAVNTIHAGMLAHGMPSAIATLDAFLIGVGSSAQALVARAMVKKRHGFPIDLDGPRAVAWLIMACGPMACVIAPSVGVAVLSMTGIVAADQVPENWLTWWVGDIAGIVVVLPIALFAPWRQSPVRWRGRPVPALTATMVIALCAMMGATMTAWKITGLVAFERNQAIFSGMTLDGEEAIGRRLDAYRASLEGAAALVSATPAAYRGPAGLPTGAEWDRFVTSLRLDSRLPGMGGMGLVVPVAHEDLATFERTIQVGGETGFRIHGNAQAPEAAVVRAIAPLTVNRAALGLDLGFEARRRAALDRARDSGETTITRSIHLVQDPQQRPAMLMITPIYAGGSHPDTVAGRRAMFVGWVYAPVVITDMVNGALPSGNRLLDLTLTDGTRPGIDPVIHAGQRRPHAEFGGNYTLAHRMTVLGQPWTATWASTPAFTREAETFEPLLVLAGGIALTLSFVALLLSLARRENYVQDQVSTKTRHLREALKALGESERRFGNLASLSPVGIVRTDCHGHLTYANAAFARACGMEPEEIDGLGWMDALHPEDREAVIRRWEAHVAGVGEGAGRGRSEFRLLHRDGSVTWIDSYSAPERDERGALIGRVGVCVDITERKSFEDALHAERIRAEEAARAKAHFLANMSHEFRTPMNAVIGFAQLLLSSPLDARQREQAQIVVESGKAMMDLLNDILDFSKIDARQMRVVSAPVALRATIKGCIRLLRPDATARGLELLYQAAMGLPEQVLVDGLRLRQILLNLIGNALKFTAEGRVTVRALHLPNERLAIEVADTGCGIAPDRQAAIFEEFSQGSGSDDQDHRGTGLGLAISRRLAELMGGTLTLSSTPGQGSTFRLEIPAPTVVASPEAELHAGVPERRRQPRATLPQAVAEDLQAAIPPRLLVAEDVEVNRMLIRAMLEPLGIGLDMAANGAEACAAVRAACAAGTPYDLVLMDVRMPVMDGIAATRALRAEGFVPALVPIVALTANAYAEDVAACLAAGMQAHLTKPVQMGALTAAVQRWRRSATLARAASAAPAAPHRETRHG